MKLAVASAHAGFRFKFLVSDYLRACGHAVIDFGTDSETPVDYPDTAARVAKAVARSLNDALRSRDRPIGVEVGEVAVLDEKENMGSRTDLNLGAVISHPGANFSEMHSTLDILLYYLGMEYKLDPAEHALFLQGRCGRVLAGDIELGFIGEIRPEVLERTQITMPCAAFEINLNRIQRR